MQLFRGAGPVFFFAAASLMVGQQPSQVPVFHAQSNLVVVDVTVEDSHGQPVRGLTAADFTLLEDGKPQSFKNFEVHANTDVAQPVPLPALPEGTFSNRPTALSSGAVNVLLIDKLNTPTKDQASLVLQLKQYVKEMPAGTRIAIFGLGSQLRMLQGVTDDPAVLRAALEVKRGAIGSSPLMSNPMAGDYPGEEKLSDRAKEVLSGMDKNIVVRIVKELQQMEAEQESQQLHLRARYTLDALNYLARYLSNFQGRKNLLWFSGSFPISILPDKDLEHPFSVVSDVEDEFRETTSLLSLAQVAVYPIDARGILTSPMLDASRPGANYAKNPGDFAKDNIKLFEQTAGEHGTMRQMAEATGGKAYVNTNGLKEAAAQAIEAGANYYTIAYSPSNTAWKGEYRKIHVKLDKQDVVLAYRRGYFAIDPSHPVSHMQVAPKAKDAPRPYDPLAAAMLHGSPAAAQVVLEVAARRVDGREEEKAAASNSVNPKTQGPFVRYEVRTTVSPSDLNCPVDASQTHHCRVEFVVKVYDADGVLMNVQASGAAITLDEARYTASLTRRIAYKQQISVPVKGEYSLRIGAYDPESGRVGALEIPVEKVAKLPPVTVQAGQ